MPLPGDERDPSQGTERITPGADDGRPDLMAAGAPPVVDLRPFDPARPAPG